jgi:hypothetical protein
MLLLCPWIWFRTHCNVQEAGVGLEEINKWIVVQLDLDGSTFHVGVESKAVPRACGNYTSVRNLHLDRWLLSWRHFLRSM